MKSRLENYISATFGQTAVEDLRNLIGEKFNPFGMINPKTAFCPVGEISFRKKTLATKARNSLKKTPLPSERQLRTGNPASRVLYINGVVTPYSLALHQTSILSQCLNEPVELLHNNTDGVFKDLIECLKGRNGVLIEIAQDAINTIEDKLDYDGNLTIVAHSQGAIIMTSALLNLAQRLPDKVLSRIHLVTIGAGVGHCVLPESLKVEHLINSYDPVTYLGIQSDKYTITGDIYVRQASGHFFISDYIIPMSKGELYGDSPFCRRICGANEK